MLHAFPMYACTPHDLAGAREFYETKVGLRPGRSGKAAWFKDSEGNIVALIEEVGDARPARARFRRETAGACPARAREGPPGAGFPARK